MTAQALGNRHRYRHAACAAVRRNRNARRIRTVSWLLRTVSVAWVVVCVLILALMARTPARHRRQEEGVRPSILAADRSHVARPKRADGAQHEETCVTWVPAHPGRAPLQAKGNPGRGSYQGRGKSNA